MGNERKYSGNLFQLKKNIINSLFTVITLIVLRRVKTLHSHYAHATIWEINLRNTSYLKVESYLSFHFKKVYQSET